jgi:hypothetical protein
MSVSPCSSPLKWSVTWSPALPINTPVGEGVPSPHEILRHFTTMTSTTVGNMKSQTITRSRVVGSALQSPYLMYAILGLAAAHLRYLLPSQAQILNTRLKVAECFYWARGLEGFRLELTGPPPLSATAGTTCSNVSRVNMDQLFSTIMLISMHQFSLRDDSGAITDVQVGPGSFVWLEDRTARDRALKWLGVQTGFKGLLQAMAPWLAESFWLPIFGAVDYTDGIDLDHVSEAASGMDEFRENQHIDCVEFHFIKLCGIEPGSMGSNPYCPSLEVLFWCRRMRPISAETFTKLLNFVSRISPDFQSLLLDRDTAALLMLVHWLTLMLEIGQWWITSRCVAEIREIVHFLAQQNHGALWVEHHVSALLREPLDVVGAKL